MDHSAEAFVCADATYRRVALDRQASSLVRVQTVAERRRTLWVASGERGSIALFGRRVDRSVAPDRHQVDGTASDHHEGDLGCRPRIRNGNGCTRQGSQRTWNRCVNGENIRIWAIRRPERTASLTESVRRLI